MTTYSVYVFLDQKDRPYYVGKTNNMKRRKREHLKEIEKGNTLPKYNKARKLIREGFYLKMRSLVRVSSEKKAFSLERHYIKQYRAEGFELLNCTHGGPYEVPMRIIKPKKVKTVGIIIPRNKKLKTKLRRKLKTKRR